MQRFSRRKGLTFEAVPTQYTRSSNYRSRFFAKHPSPTGKYRCAYCGKKKPKDKITIDHIFPVHCMEEYPAVRRRAALLGIHGSNDMKNLCTACMRCNQKKEAKEHKKRNRVKARKNKRIFAFTWLAMVILVSLTLASYLIGGSNDFLGVDRTDSEVEVTIPENVTQDQLTDILYKSHAIDKPEFFSLFCKFTTEMEYFEPGTYTIKTNYDYKQLVNTLQSGPDLGEEITVMFREGITVQQLAALLEENGLHTADEILEACNSSDYDSYSDVAAITNTSDRYYKLEGYLFPDTYQFFENDTVESILDRFLNNFENKLTDEMRDDIAKSGYTTDQIITLASIIQAEAANTDDMYMISAILRNRLENGAEHDIHTLDCDSTVYYPYKTANDAPEGFVSSYSTYDNSGLPAGPICNPGLEAIKAAIYPSEEGSEYYFFCHDSDGTPYYASTMDDHLMNMAEAGLL